MENGWREEGLWDIWGGGNWERGNHLECKQRIQKMWYIYTMEYYSAIKNNEFMKVAGKWLELENIILSEVTQSQKIYMECNL